MYIYKLYLHKKYTLPPTDRLFIVMKILAYDELI